MRKALTLVEVMVAIVLITVVIGAILKMKNNNLFLLDRFSLASLNDTYLSMAYSKDNSKSKTISLNEVVDFKNDDIRKELKEIKITTIVNDDKKIKLPKNDYVPSAKIIESKYMIDKKNSKIFYTFELEYLSE